MFLLFSPFTFLFLLVYLVIFLACFSIPSFLCLWVMIELIILVFMGLSFTLFTSSMSFLMLYFLIQVFSSFSFLVFYCLDFHLLFSLSIMLNLSMFPFHFWFVTLVARFPHFILYLSSSLHNVPFFLFVLFFNLPLNLSLVYVCILFSTVMSGLAMINLHNSLFVIASSSISSNSWFFISSLASFETFLQFFVVYSLSLLFTLFHLTVNYKLFNWFLLSISGLPPFPLFFSNAFSIFSCFMCFMPSSFLLLFLLLNSTVFIGYIFHTFNFFSFQMSNLSI